MGPEPNGLKGAMIALIAIFFPSFLLVTGALPFWDQLRSKAVFQSALKGISAAVVGLLLTALYNPVWTSAIHSPADFGLGLVAFGLLMFWRFPPWLVVALTALGGETIARLS
jgi:chromate transporter